MAAYNPSIVAAIASAITPSTIGIIVDGGDMDAASTVGIQLDGYAIFNGVDYYVPERQTMSQVTAVTLPIYASCIDVSTVLGNASVTFFRIRSLISTDATEGTTDGTTF